MGNTISSRAKRDYFIHPLRYPEWAEMLLALIGLGAGISAVWLYDDLPNRSAYDLTLLLFPQGWTVAGFILCGMHLCSLHFGSGTRRHIARLIAASSSLAFYVHFILSVTLNSVFFGGPFPGLLPLAMTTPALAAAVLYRLWRQY